jgi:hypothetical protein
MTLCEAHTRTKLIDPQLRKAGWRLEDRTQVRLEIPVDGYDADVTWLGARPVAGAGVGLCAATGQIGGSAATCGVKSLVLPFEVGPR